MKKWTFLIFLMAGIFRSPAQDAGTLIQGGLSDGNKLVKAYLAPLNKAILFGLGQNNYQSFSLDDNHHWSLGLHTTFLMAPPEERVYDVNQLGLETLEAEDPHNSIAQTVLGDSTQYIYIQSKRRDLFGRPLFKFKSPTGYGFPGVPVPYFNLAYSGQSATYSLGFIPPLPIPTTGMTVYLLKGNAQWNLFSLLGWESGRNEWSAGLQYAFFHGMSRLDVKPDNVYTYLTVTGNLSGPYDNQKLLIDYHSLSVSTYLAHHLGRRWKIFAGGGITGGISFIRMKGIYPVYSSDPTGNFSIVAEDVEDPLDISQEAAQWYLEGGIRADWKRFYLQLQGDYGQYYGGALQLGYKFK